MKLPLFPKFSPISLSHRQFIQTYTAQFDPYSDYNFVSIFTNNEDNTFLGSLLYDNLVIQMNDYVTEKPFITFLGTNNIQKTVEKLLTFSKSQFGETQLKLIPEISIAPLLETQSSSFIITEDQNGHDYIHDAHEIALLEHHKYFSKRRMVHKFRNKFSQHSISILDTLNPTVQQRLLALFDEWTEEKQKKTSDVQIERKAISRALIHAKELNLHCLGIYVNEELSAYSISELIHNNYFMAHFGKSNYQHIGIFQVLIHETNKFMHSLGASYMNFEQDLGFSGLRQSKLSWHPTKYLKKYTISNNT